MVKFFFRTGFVLVLIGVLGTLTFQYLFPWGGKPSHTTSDGPAERVGEVVDRGISGLGKLTELAGKKMQKATAGAEQEKVVGGVENTDEITDTKAPERHASGRSLFKNLDDPPEVDPSALHK